MEIDLAKSSILQDFIYARNQSLQMPNVLNYEVQFLQKVTNESNSSLNHSFL